MSQPFEHAVRMIEAMYAAALDAADPRRAVARSITIEGDNLLVAGKAVKRGGRLVVIAIGKAAVTMAQGATDALGARIGAGIAITKDGHAGDVSLDRFDIFEARHPIPDERGVAATCRAIELVESCGDGDVVLALISGGGSALFEAPRPPVTLGDLAMMTDLLLKAGAPIEDLNAARTPLSMVKGGGLLRLASPATVVTLILSDVLGNDPSVIASGPTVPGAASRAGSRRVLERYDLWDRVPESIRTVLGEPERDAGRVDSEIVEIIADNDQAVAAARREAERQDLSAETIWHERTGEAREEAIAWVSACEQAGASVDCLLGGGELTVTVTGDGIGGRNTEFVLAAAIELNRRGIDDWVIASLATDGQDGPTDVAGGITDRSLVARATSAGIDPFAALDRNDSLAALRAGGRLVEPGPTGTNVNDLYIAIRTIPKVAGN